MALTVETGANVTGADCYDTLANYAAWELRFYETALEATDAAKEAAIRRAVTYLDGLAWKGKRSNGRSQPLAWPRTDVTDSEGNAIDDDEVPLEVIFAQHRLTRAEIIEPGALDAEFAASDSVKREKVGEIEVEYSRSASNADDLKKTVAMAMDAIQGLLNGPDATGGGTVWLDRA